MKKRLRGRTIIFWLLFLSFGSTYRIPPAAAQVRQNYAGSQAKKKAVKIYLTREPKEGEPFDPENPSNLHPVIRMVERAAPLRPTLEALLAGPSPVEKSQGYIDISYGIKLTKVKIKEGTVRADFTMPPGAAFSGDTSPFIFKGAVEMTIRQFPGVKKIIVCLDGAVDIGSESGEPPKKCPEL